MKILVTNDDGINAYGLHLLTQIAQDIAGDTGTVWTVAPAFEQSGVGHCVSYHKPMLIEKFDDRVFAVEGTPADCVIAGIHHVFAGELPDLVLSGINRGNNSGENVVYSGTLGAAMEAALQGVAAIGLSQFSPAKAGYYAPNHNKPFAKRKDDEGFFSTAATYAGDMIKMLLRHGFTPALARQNGYRTFYNVNFPPVAANRVKGVRFAHQGFRPQGVFGIENYTNLSGRSFLWAKSNDQHARPTDAHSDVSVNLDGYIAITPLRADLTAYDDLDALKRSIDIDTMFNT